MPETGQHISHYKILSAIGAGGMGEVYLAQDSKLDRRVALKILPPAFAEDKDRMSRFVLEAKAASALNHPNIITIYEIGEAEGTHFIATEFIDGATLTEYARREPLDYISALEIAVQVASGLVEAHSAGIIHRDIKPDNIMIRENGLAKILDFGIAKLSAQPAAANGSSEDATAIKPAATTPGMIIGTANYMSPEQARGLAVDHQTDIFSFGVVFYEMLSGASPFAGETVSDVIAAVLTKEPSPLANILPELAAIVQKTLHKEKQKRYQSAKDLLRDLKEVRQELEIRSRIGRNSASNAAEPKTQILKAPTTAENETQNSIAVLPFTNISADEENEYFCDGLAEELLNALSKIEDLRVAARTSAFSFKNKNVEVSQIGKTLNVKTILEGSVRKAGNKLRITVQLINAADGYHLWSERYDREMRDIFDVQDEIALAVVDALKLKLFGALREAVLKRYTDNTEAYQLYLKGQFQYGKHSEAGWRKAIEYFERALALEPNYAPAYAGIGAAGNALWYYGYDARPEALAEVRAAIAEALGIDADLSEAYRSQALLEFFADWDFPAAGRNLARALALNPNDAAAHSWHGFWLIVMGQREQSVKAARRALGLDPLSLASGVIAGWTLWFAERYEESLALAQTLLEINPHFGEGFRLLGLSHWGLENYEAAAEALQKAIAEGTTIIAQANLCGVYASAGKQAEARQILQQIREVREKSYVPAVALAYCYAFLDEVEEAFVWLEQALAERNGELVFLNALPDRWISFHSDPRFDDLRRRIGLPTEEERQTVESPEAKTAILSSGELKTEQPDNSKTRNESGEINAEQANNLKSEIPNPKSKWWLFGLLGLLVLAVSGFFGSKYFVSNKQIESIAVMPFINESGNSDVEYLSDGMTETLINSLSQVPNLSVKARSSVFRYKGKELDPKKIASELNVQAILTGRVVQRGDQLTLNLELIDARTENLLWGNKYDRKASDLVSLQSEIARDVSGKLKAKLSGADETRLANNGTTDSEAYQSYLKGRYFHSKGTNNDVQQSLKYFQEAVNLDPKFARGYAGLADAYTLLGTVYNSTVLPAEVMPKARTAAEKAIELDPNLSEAYTALAWVKFRFDWDWAGAEKDFKKAIELDPNNAQAHQWYGEYLSCVMRETEAIAELKRARELEPFSLIMNWNVAKGYLGFRRFDEAIEEAKNVLEMDKNYVPAYRILR
ncbi:MAG TPA: protein kinase, partial [Pyrinomonadaceae bacterium]|nr:protein kinase [Pyrinomonadaceae bacterium]